MTAVLPGKNLRKSSALLCRLFLPISSARVSRAEFSASVRVSFLVAKFMDLKSKRSAAGSVGFGRLLIIGANLLQRRIRIIGRERSETEVHQLGVRGSVIHIGQGLIENISLPKFLSGFDN